MQHAYVSRKNCFYILRGQKDFNTQREYDFYIAKSIPSFTGFAIGHNNKCATFAEMKTH